MTQRLIDNLPLRPGSHEDRDDGLCAMEMVAYLAGEAHSDEPRCACPVVSAYVRAFNDMLPDDAARRYYLAPLVPRLIGTWSPARESERAYAALDHALRVLAADYVESRGRRSDAEKIRTMEPVRTRLDARVAWIQARDLDLPRQITWMLRMAANGVPATQWIQSSARLMALLGPKGYARGVQLMKALIRGPVAITRAV